MVLGLEFGSTDELPGKLQADRPKPGLNNILKKGGPSAQGFSAGVSGYSFNNGIVRSG